MGWLYIAGIKVSAPYAHVVSNVMLPLYFELSNEIYKVR